MKLMHLPRIFYITGIYFFLYLPIVVIVIFSFNNAVHSMLWHGFTLKWYKVLLHDVDIFTVVAHSLTIGTLAASFATLIGTIAVVSIFRYRFSGRKLLYGIVLILIVSPDIILGIALLIFYSVLAIPLGFWSLLIAHVTFCVPFVVVTVYSRVITLDRNIFEAAKDLGANDFTIFTRIIIPLLLPAILAGWFLSFTLSLDDVIISYFVSGPSYEILPLKIYSMVKVGVKPEINALCALILIATLLIVVSSQFVRKIRKN